ncbi:MAG: helix-turn-helix transcriptional regulator [Planctomycetota bacterium]|jgi:predicted DNA-binding transcriptional regulator AlpA
MNDTPETSPLLLSARDAAKLCGIGLRTWHSYRASGKLPPSFKIGGRRVWKRKDIYRWVDWDFPNLDRFIDLEKINK